MDFTWCPRTHPFSQVAVDPHFTRRANGRLEKKTQAPTMPKCDQGYG